MLEAALLAGRDTRLSFVIGVGDSLKFPAVNEEWRSMEVNTDGSGGLVTMTSGNNVTVEAALPGTLELKFHVNHRRTGAPFTVSLDIRSVSHDGRKPQ